jgi:hypothetical protein
MVLVIQIIGALFGAFFLYLAFLNFKRKEFSVNEWLVWSAVALIFVVVMLIPDILNPVIRTLNIGRKMDLMIIAGFMFLTGAIFYTYRISLKNKKKLEEVVRKIAIDNADKTMKKR